MHGAFCSPCYSQKYSLPFESASAQYPPPKLPQEIWDMVIQYDVGRLLFITRAVSQLEKLNINSVKSPMQRFIVKWLILKSNVIRIRLVNLGGQTYVGSFSNPPKNNDKTQALSAVALQAIPLLQSLTGSSWSSRFQCQDYMLNHDGSTYFATKSDGMGIIDLAFRRAESGSEWILNNQAMPFLTEISEARYAEMRDLTVISDTSEKPYLVGNARPPNDCWVDSAFPVESHLTKNADPFAYIGRAKYVPLAGITNMTIASRRYAKGDIEGLLLVLVESCKNHSVDFSRSPQRLKFLKCHLFGEYPFLQVEIDGKWEPHVPLEDILCETIIENAVGFWWAETFRFTPVHIGVVVSQKRNLKNSWLLTIYIAGVVQGCQPRTSLPTSPLAVLVTRP